MSTSTSSGELPRTHAPAWRAETDSMGTIPVPAPALYGAQTQRALLNFQVSGQPMPAGFIRALLRLKVAATLAVVAFGLMGAMLPWGLAFAAGAMLFVVSHEVIPESHRQGHERWATTGLLLGFVVMMMLDTAMG